MSKSVTVSDETFKILDGMVKHHICMTKKDVVDEAINILYVRNISPERFVRICENKHNLFEKYLDLEYPKKDA